MGFELHLAAEHGDLAAVERLLLQGESALTQDDSGKTPLHYALRLAASATKEQKSTAETIARKLINKAPTTITTEDNAGDTPIHFMATFGFDSLLTEIIKLSPQKTTISNNAGISPIHAAIQNQQHEAVKALLQWDGASILDMHQNTLLHHAASANNLTSMMALFEKQPTLNPNLENSDGQTPLDIANSAHFDSICDYLVTKGALSGRSPFSPQ